jgi:uncharacterized membrane protein YvbJ
LRKKWGMNRCSEKAVSRPQFRGKKAFNNVSGLLEEFERTTRKRGKQLISYSTILLWAFLVIIAIYYLLMAQRASQDRIMEMAIAVANAIQIQVYNLIYSYIADSLNN